MWTVLSAIQLALFSWINSPSIVNFLCKTTRMQEQGETFEAKVFLSIWPNRLEKNRERGNKKIKSRTRSKREWEDPEKQKINRKRDRISSGQIVTIVFVTIVFVSSLQHQVSLSSPTHNLITLFTVQIAHAQMRQEGRSRWILLLANPRFER
jgi:hypothetical protein